NAYLVDGPNILVTSSSRPISPVLMPVSFGSMPNDGGNLIVEVDDHEIVSADPVAAKYLRPFRGSQELINGLQRWCLWMENLDPADVKKSEILLARIENVRQKREASSRAATKALAQTPHLFGERRQLTTDYLCIPSVVSENRPYFTAAQMPEDVITSNLAFQTPDTDGLQFALISSSMFITWQKTVGGRLESRLRFSGTLVWNNFPVPHLDEAIRERIIKAGRGILAARELHPERSLAEHYNPLAMDPGLLKAHDVLDREVDKAFGAERKLSNARQRQELLFANYSRLSSI